MTDATRKVTRAARAAESAEQLLGCYDVTMLRCYDVTLLRCYLDLQAKDFTTITKDDLKKDLEEIMNKSESRINNDAVIAPGVIDDLSGNDPICNHMGHISQVLIESRPGLPCGETITVEAYPLGWPTDRWCGFGGIYRLIRPNIRTASGLAKPDTVSTSANSRFSVGWLQNLQTTNETG
jgi:hypothetical protein